MSHEIRTPLMGVVGMLEILSRTSLTDEQRRIIATANESSAALMRIVDDVLDFAKLEFARAALSPAATDLADLLEGCTETLACRTVRTRETSFIMPICGKEDVSNDHPRARHTAQAEGAPSC